MAVITPTTRTPKHGIVLFTWGPMVNGDTGAPVQAPDYPDKSVMVTGTFGAGGNCRIQGTLETITTPTLWQTLADPQGNVLDFGAAKVEAILENTFQYRPNVTAGDGTTSLTVVLQGRAQPS